MGLSWWFNPDLISATNYFKFVPTKLDYDLQIIGNSDINYLENQLEKSQDTSAMSEARELLNLREAQKDGILNDLNLVFSQCFSRRSQLKSPKSEDLLDEEILMIAERIVALRKKLL